MILMSTSLLGEIPFEQVVLHGIVRDSKGQKFSKSLDNGIDPVDMADKFGTDALASIAECRVDDVAGRACRVGWCITAYTSIGRP